MKKVLLTILICLIATIQTSFAKPVEYDDIYNNENIIYDLDNNIWTTNYKPKTSTVIDKETGEEIEIEEEYNIITLTKKRTSKIGSYTVFMDKKNPAIATTSDYEFIHNGQLIAIDNTKLKYYEIIYKDGKFIQIPLSETKMKEIFHNAEIVKISEFNNDTYSTQKNFFAYKTILLVNDTDRKFYKYSYRPPRVQSTEVIGFIKTFKYGKILFSHYGEKENSLTIRITR